VTNKNDLIAYILLLLREYNCKMTKDIETYLNTIIAGDCLKNLSLIPDKSVDLIFADPPYWMQTEGELLRTNGDKFK